ncbi:MAG: thioredoxin domain-containing protein [Elusimicrobiota bacterium]|jgi:protein-disulfide isomerase
MKTLLFILLSAGISGAHAVDSFDQEAFYRHVRKAFSAPSSLKLNLKELKPSEIPGFKTGLLEIGEAPQQQTQRVHITDDGRYYILSSAYRLGPSKIPGLSSALSQENGAEPPAVHLTKDGKFLLLGQPQDLSLDPDEQNRLKIKVKGAPGWGPADAPITLVEYSDFQCPHCKKAFEALENEILPKYPGKIRVLFKHYPLTNIHPLALDTAIASACADQQPGEGGRKLKGLLFAQQTELKKEDFSAKVLEFAKQAGLSAKPFEKCFSKQASKASVEADMAEATELGVTGTPALFVNGRRAPHYNPEIMTPIIDEMLSSRP